MYSTNVAQEKGGRRALRATTTAATENTAKEADGNALRQAAVGAMMRTPGWNDRFQTMFLFAPRADYERMSAEYARDPLAMPLPFMEWKSRSRSDEQEDGVGTASGIPSSYAYNSAKVIETLSHFEIEGFILRYSGISDRFSIFAADGAGEVPDYIQRRMRAVYKRLPQFLRKDFPDRFSKGQPDFSVVISTGDSPKLHCECLSISTEKRSGDHHDFWEIMMNEQTKEEPTDNTPSLSSSSPSCNPKEFSPIWNFASGFIHPETLPTMVNLPPYGEHLRCFESFRFQNRVCDAFLERDDVLRPEGELFFGREFVGINVDVDVDVGVDVNVGVDAMEANSNENGNKNWEQDYFRQAQIWESRQEELKLVMQQEGGVPRQTQRKLRVASYSSPSHSSTSEEDITAANIKTNTIANNVQVPIYHYLLPQIMWRGSNFQFLNCLPDGYRRYKFPPEMIRTPGSSQGDSDAARILNGLEQQWGHITPRWKAVALSAMAELEGALDGNSARINDHQQQRHTLPWINAKFTDGHRSKTETEQWERFAEQGVDVVADHFMNWEEASTYKYHIDIGGGGGTT